MHHPTTSHVDAWRDHLHTSAYQSQLSNYAETQIRPRLPPHVNLDYVPPHLLKPRTFTRIAMESKHIGGGMEDRMAPIRRSIACGRMPIGTDPTTSHTSSEQIFGPPSREQIREIISYGHTPSSPYNSADFPPRIGATDLKRGGTTINGSSSSGGDFHSLSWDPQLDQTSSKQFRTRQEQGIKFRSFLHPPPSPQRRATSAGITSHSNPSTSRSMNDHHGSIITSHSRPSTSSTHPKKRYHRPLKAALPTLNGATYAKYMANTHPLLAVGIAGRRRCQMSIWRDELLKRKIDPHADTHI